MPDLLQTLIQRAAPVDRPTWSDFWERLHERRLREGEALAVLASLATRVPQASTMAAFLASLAERTGPLPARWPGTVNLVGTGGGPATFNLTTAAVLVAAATGVGIVKTGSRGYTSRHGSIDILEQLGIPIAGSYAECEEGLERHNLAFAGAFVYPPELTELARAVLPYGFKQVGRFVNLLGPLLAAVPVQAQLTGVSDPELFTPFTELVADRRIWLVRNELGVDELVSFTENTLWAEGVELLVGPDTLPLDRAALPADLGPAPVGLAPTEHLLALLGGHGPRAAVESIALNAAAAAVVSGLRSDWTKAYQVALDAVHAGAALELVARLRREAGAGG